MVQLIGTETKSEIRKGPKGEQMKDIRYVVVKGIPSGLTLMFRNEDMPWPPYLKFDSSDLSGKVETYEEHNPEAEILITYYGIRMRSLNLYPNITRIEKKVGKEPYLHIFSRVVFSVSFLFSVLGLFFILRKFDSKNDEVGCEFKDPFDQEYKDLTKG